MRYLIGLESWGSQCWPLRELFNAESDLQKHGHHDPFAQGFLAGLSTSAHRQLTGNMMNMRVVGGVLQMALTLTKHVGASTSSSSNAASAAHVSSVAPPS